MAAGGGGSSCGSQPLPAAQHYPTTRLGAPLTLPPLPPPSGPGPRGGRGAVTRTAAAVGGSHSSGRCVGGAGRGGGGLVGTARTASSCHPCGPWTASCSCRRTWPARTHTAAAFRGDEAERRRTPRERSDPREDRFLIVDKNFCLRVAPQSYISFCRLLICATARQLKARGNTFSKGQQTGENYRQFRGLIGGSIVGPGARAVVAGPPHRCRHPLTTGSTMVRAHACRRRPARRDRRRPRL